MFGKNLKYYRLKNNMSMKELGDLVNVSSMAISYYEKEERRPNMETIKALASALHVNVTDFIASRDESLTFCHGEFRKNTKLLGRQQEYVREEVEEYFGRFYETLEILGGDILPAAPSRYVLELTDDVELNAKKMRQHLGLSPYGSIGNIIELLEARGILVYLCDVGNDDFSGMNGTVNDRTYIIVNSSMTAERIRSTLVHEMAHFMFLWPEDMEDKLVEKMATAISGAFLIPREDVLRKLGVRRSYVSNDMTDVCKEYGISMYLLVKRANLNGTISDNVAKTFYIQAGKAGWKKNEPSRITAENPRLFSQLVFRAVGENEITAQKGSELLRIPYDEVLNGCAAVEV